MARFLVPVMVEVSATSKKAAAEHVAGLMEYAFEVSNDEGRFKEWSTANKADIQKIAAKAAV